jgi:uncharacterized protein (DUF433 family)
MSTTPTPPWKYLSRKPGSRYKQLFVTGRNIAARTLYGQYASETEPRTPEQIAADHNLPLEVVLEAIAYCESDPPEIQEDWRREEALAQATGMNDPGYKYNPRPRMLSPRERARLNGQ